MTDPLSHKVTPIKRRKRRKPLSEEIRSMYKLLSVVVVIFSVISTGSYLYMNSLKPAKGYTLKQLQLDYEALQSEQRELAHKIMEVQSFDGIEERAEIQEMDPSTDQDFSYAEDQNFTADSR